MPFLLISDANNGLEVINRLAAATQGDVLS
jgi:hypothetical protein